MSMEQSEQAGSMIDGRWPIGAIIGCSLFVGLALAIVLVTVPFAAAEENVISGVVLLSFALGWGLMAALSMRFTDQPQRWAIAPAVLMGLAGGVMLAWPDSVTYEVFGWIWPPVLLVLVVWMLMHVRHDLHSRARALLLYPLFAVLAVGALGGAVETALERLEDGKYDRPGELVSVGDHRLHLYCTGSGSPTVILEAGLGDFSVMMTAWIAPDVAKDTRVCAYDRAGRGWSESASGPQDGVEVATDLHTLLANAGVEGPYVLAGHSAGGAYVLNFANLYPTEVAGVVLLDSMSPNQYEGAPTWPRFYHLWRRASALAPSLAHLGVMRVVAQSSAGTLPTEERNEQRTFSSAARHWRSQRDEFYTIRTTLREARELKSIGAKPLIVLSAVSGALEGWMPLQDELADLSTNSVHRVVEDATHASLVDDEDYAAMSAQAIRDVVESVRTGDPLAQ
jgi:pimeloyl-ACP methyl ester carboxylesterase